MGDVKNLYSSEAIKKVKDLVDAANTCMFTSQLSKVPLAARPMSTIKVDDDGTLWFFSKKSSEKNDELSHDNKVQLFYANNNSAEYLSIFGEASIVQDKQLAKELWTPIAKTWFTKGVDDPELSILKVHPLEAYYWDTKSNKMVAMLKIIAGAVTGKTMDDGVEGNIKI